MISRREQGLADVPDDIPANVTILYLSDNKISTLRQNSFKHLSECRHLYLHRNRISHIADGAFSGLGNLRQLKLQENLLFVLRLGMFKGLDSLNELYMCCSHTDTIQNGSFLDLANLHRLDLRTNRLTELRAEMFLGLISLRIIQLVYNHFTTIDASVFSHLPRPLEVQLTELADPRALLLNCDSRLCWLKEEEEFGTIIWYRTYGYHPIMKPGCMDGLTWAMLDCNITGLLPYDKSRNLDKITTYEGPVYTQRKRTQKPKRSRHK